MTTPDSMVRGWFVPAPATRASGIDCKVGDSAQIRRYREFGISQFSALGACGCPVPDSEIQDLCS